MYFQLETSLTTIVYLLSGDDLLTLTCMDSFQVNSLNNQQQRIRTT